MPHPVAAGNFLIPNMTFVVELAAFLIVLAFLSPYATPPARRAVTVRQDMARQLISDRGEATRLLEEAQTAYQAAMAGARREAAQLRAEAEKQRREIIAGASAEADARAAEIISRGQARLAAERQQAIGQLKADLGNAATNLAEMILSEALADDERQRRLIDGFLSQLEEGARA